MSILLLLYGISTPTAQPGPPPPVVITAVPGGAGGVFTRRPQRSLPEVIRADRKFAEMEDEDVLLALQ